MPGTRRTCGLQCYMSDYDTIHQDPKLEEGQGHLRASPMTEMDLVWRCRYAVRVHGGECHSPVRGTLDRGLMAGVGAAHHLLSEKIHSLGWTSRSFGGTWYVLGRSGGLSEEARYLCEEKKAAGSVAIAWDLSSEDRTSDLRREESRERLRSVLQWLPWCIPRCALFRQKLIDRMCNLQRDEGRRWLFLCYHGAYLIFRQHALRASSSSDPPACLRIYTTGSDVADSGRRMGGRTGLGQIATWPRCPQQRLVT